MKKVGIYQLATNVTRTYTTIGGTAEGKSSINWIGNTQVDIVNQALHKSVSTEYGGAMHPIHDTVETYVVSGYIYVKANSDSGYSNTYNVWYKSKASGSDWTWDSQTSKLIGLMQSSTVSILAGREKVDDIDCYILNIQPSTDAVANWVSIQFQLPGPSDFDFSGYPHLGGKEDYLKFFKSGSFKIWVAKDSYFVMKAEIIPHFEATPQDFGVTSPTNRYTNFSKIMSDFQGEIHFFKYNQPVLIQPPPDSEVVSR
jgi:hypothetical protein